MSNSTLAFIQSYHSNINDTSYSYHSWKYLVYLPPALVFTQTPSPTPPPEKKTPLSGVASALKGVEFIAQHIRKADKDTEVSERGNNRVWLVRAVF